MSGYQFDIRLVQPTSAGAATAAPRVAGTESPAFVTPGVSPIATDGGAPSEPLRQFMTEKLEGNNLYYTPDSAPTTPGEEPYEFHNTGFAALRQKGKAAAIRPGRSAASGPHRVGKNEKAGPAAASVSVVAPQEKRSTSAAGQGLLASKGGGEAAEAVRSGRSTTEKDAEQAAKVGESPPSGAEASVSEEMVMVGADRVPDETIEQFSIAEYNGSDESSSAESSLEPAAEPLGYPTGFPTGYPTGYPAGHATHDAKGDDVESPISTEGLVLPVHVAEDAAYDAKEDDIEEPTTAGSLVLPVRVAHPGEVARSPATHGVATFTQQVHALSLSSGDEEPPPLISPPADGVAGRTRYQMQTPTLISPTADGAARGRTNYQTQTPTLTPPVSGAAWHSDVNQHQLESQKAIEQLEVENFADASPLRGEAFSVASSERPSFLAQTPISSIHGAEELPPPSQQTPMSSMHGPAEPPPSLPAGKLWPSAAHQHRQHFQQQQQLHNLRQQQLQQQQQQQQELGQLQQQLEDGSYVAGPSPFDDGDYDDEMKDSSSETPQERSVVIARSYTEEDAPISPLQTLTPQNATSAPTPTPSPPHVSPLTRQPAEDDSVMGSLSSDSA